MADYFSLFQALLTRSQEAYFVYHPGEQRVVYANDTFARFVAELAPAPLGDAAFWAECLHPDDLTHLRRQLAAAADEEPVEDLEVRARRADGSMQWFTLTVYWTPYQGQRCLAGRARDITRAKEVAINAQKFNTKKNATLEILSHDLAAPLVLLQQLTDHLRAESGDVREPVQHLLTLMERTCREGVDLIRTFVDHEFLESASVVMHWERTDLTSWLGTVMEEYQQSSWHTHLAFGFHAPQPVYALVDVDKFQQVVNNLVSNAIKFTPDGGRIDVDLRTHTHGVQIRVQDTGVGIPAHLQPVLFDKFTKARRPGLRGEKTTGLGMSVIRTIVELHQGRIWFESEEGRGTTFVIELPAH